MNERQAIRETLQHIRRVQQLLHGVVVDLLERGRVHDASKLSDPELSAFVEYTPKLRNCTYGSDEYKRYLEELKPALSHHYLHNRHHPEHWHNGIADMSLVDLIEMLVDWKAATERHDDGDLMRSIELNKERFGYGDEMARLLTRTAEKLWPQWKDPWHCFACGNGGAVSNFCEMCGAGKNDYDAK